MLGRLCRIVILAVALGWTSGCGGGASSVTVRDAGGALGAGVRPDFFSTTLVSSPLKITYLLPTGYKVPAGGLRISGGLFDSKSIVGNSATLTTWKNGRALVGIVDTSGNPVLLGFISPSHTGINTTTTAEVLLYYAIGGYLAAEPDQTNLLQALDREPGLYKIGASINAELLLHGNISAATGSFRTNVATEASIVLGTYAISHKPAGVKHLNSPRMSPKGIILPQAGYVKAGVTADYGPTANSVILKNSTCRSQLMILNRISRVTSNGTTTPSFGLIGEANAAPVTANGARDIQANLFRASPGAGNFDTYTTSPPIGLPAVATGYASENYEVVGVCGGDNLQTPPSLTVQEKADVKAFYVKAFVRDYFFPLISRSLLGASLDIYNFNFADATALDKGLAAHEAQAEAVLAKYPLVLADVQVGDFQKAMLDFANAGISTTNLTDFSALYASVLSSAALPTTGTQARFHEVLSWISKAAFPANKLLTPDSVLSLMIDYIGTSPYETWDFSVTNHTFQVNASAKSVDGTNPNASVTFTAVPPTDPLPKGSKYVCRFSSYDPSSISILGFLYYLDHPTQLVGGFTSSFKAFWSRTNGVNANEPVLGGTLTATVDFAIQDGGGNITVIGTAKRSVLVSGPTKGQSPTSSMPHTSPFILITPSKLSVQPGKTAPTISFHTETMPAELANTIVLKWSCTNKFGTIDVPSGPTSTSACHYTAGPKEGQDTVTCAFSLDGGHFFSSQDVEILVQNHTAFLPGAVFIRSGADATVAGVTIPRVLGAKSYQVHCYGFDDLGTDTWDFTVYGDGTDNSGNKYFDIDYFGHRTTKVGADGVYYIPYAELSGTPSTDPATIPGNIAYYRKRMAGMQVDVTVVL